MDIIEINRRQTFTHQEAQELLPVVFKITKTYSLKVEALIERLEGLNGCNEEITAALESQVNQLIQDWQTKVQKLGAQPKGLWIADFDSGDGYYCWKYPERAVDFWHRYNDGFSRRIPVSERRAPISLQDRLKKKFFTLPTAGNMPVIPMIPPITLMPSPEQNP